MHCQTARLEQYAPDYFARGGAGKSVAVMQTLKIATLHANI